VKSIKSSIATPCLAKAGGFVTNGCVEAAFSPGTVDPSTARSSIGHTGWPLVRSSTYTQPCLVGWASALIRRPFTVMSTRIGAHGMSKSQMPWCTSW
jgi:hypothetical protein